MQHTKVTEAGITEMKRQRAALQAQQLATTTTGVTEPGAGSPTSKSCIKAMKEVSTLLQSIKDGDPPASANCCRCSTMSFGSLARKKAGSEAPGQTLDATASSMRPIAHGRLR